MAPWNGAPAMLGAMNEYIGYCTTRWIAIVTCDSRLFSGSSGEVESTPN
jgi:hypothetical protein